jgi:hypothetical protein
MMNMSAISENIISNIQFECVIFCTLNLNVKMIVFFSKASS